LWLFEPLYPASSYVTVDKDIAHIPPHAILPHVMPHPKKTDRAKKKWRTKEKIITFAK